MPKEVVAAFDSHIQRIWAAHDECSLAIKSSAEAASTAFVQCFTDFEVENLNYARDNHRDIRSRGGKIIDKVIQRPDVPYSVKVTVLMELATYEARGAHQSLSHIHG